MNRIVYIKAEVIGQQEKTLTVKLLNGFGNPEEIVHIDSAIELATGGIITKAPEGLSGCCGGRI